MIRRATMKDFDAGCEASFLDAALNNTILPVDPHKFYGAVERAVAENRAFVAESDGKIVGSMAYEVFTPFYSSHSAVHDLWVNVAPDHRRSSAGGRLLAALKEEARIRALPWFVGATGQSPAAEPMYDRHFDLVGRIYRGK